MKTQNPKELRNAIESILKKHGVDASCMSEVADEIDNQTLALAVAYSFSRLEMQNAKHPEDIKAVKKDAAIKSINELIEQMLEVKIVETETNITYENYIYLLGSR